MDNYKYVFIAIIVVSLVTIMTGPFTTESPRDLSGAAYEATCTTPECLDSEVNMTNTLKDPVIRLG